LSLSSFCDLGILELTVRPRALWMCGIQHTIELCCPVSTYYILQEDDAHVIIVHKLIAKCNFTFFENTQRLCLREGVCLCVCVYLCLCVGEWQWQESVHFCVCLFGKTDRDWDKNNPLTPVCEGF
jgi:hypothetical protein